MMESRDPLKLLIRGGSIAAGCGVTRNYVERLRERFRHRPVEIINRSRPGETSFDGVDSLDNDIAVHRPDMLLLHFGIDDAYGCVYRSEFKENLVRMVRLAQERLNPAVLLATSHPFENIHDMEAVGLYYRTLREVALDLGCRLIPVHTHWAGCLQESRLPHAAFVQADVRLPNGRGHQLLADIVGAHLDAMLQERVSRHR